MRMFRKFAVAGTAAAASAVLFAGSALAANAYAYADGLVVSSVGLKVRANATTASRVVGTLAPRQKVRLACQVQANWVEGNNVWYRLHGRPGWVSARYVHNYTNVPWC
ncbi:SH3 domain-containing protein [Streptomyces sp. NPDC058655]|uniref:SH3 domain-containing protein n=1 Tax=unclassified Streptomyces TaxID=2593676 RepID=UPI0036639C1C